MLALLLMNLQVTVNKNLLQGRQSLDDLVQTTQQHTRILSDIQKSIPKPAPLTNTDALNFVDALGRRFSLPFTYFSHWEVSIPYTTQSLH
jgi:hypothetical protein